MNDEIIYNFAFELEKEERWKPEDGDGEREYYSAYQKVMDKSNKKLDLKPLISTRNFLAEIIQNAQNDYEKAGAIQAFEVCYELAKNTIRKILLLRAQEVHITPKEIFRLAGLEGLIANAEIWFEFAKKRNKTSHTYDGEVAEEILSSLPNFLRELDLLIKSLEKIPECYNSNLDTTK